MNQIIISYSNLQKIHLLINNKHLLNIIQYFNNIYIYRFINKRRFCSQDILYYLMKVMYL
jgi:hypothetical protein